MTSEDRFRHIRLILSDVDGVLTDGGLYYTDEGLVMKKFQVKDGMGMRLLRLADIKNAIITTDDSELIKIRGEKLKADYVFLGIWDKEKKLLEICESENISPENTAFIGDDVNDIGIIDAAGISACPNDAVNEIKDRVDLTLQKNGGEGVFREFSDLILQYKSQL